MTVKSQGGVFQQLEGRGTFALEALASPPGNKGNVHHETIVLPPCDLTSPLLSQPPMRGTLHLLFTRNGEKSPPPREASLAHATPGGAPEGCLATL